MDVGDSQSPLVVHPRPPSCHHLEPGSAPGAPEPGRAGPTAPVRGRAAGLAARVERLVREHPRLIPRLQGAMIAFYLVLILAPPLLPEPKPSATPLNDFVRFAQFAIWSIWWPFVLLSLLFFGRAWCGVLCPEGALAHLASRAARHRPVPQWLTWGGIPLLAFVGITTLGQVVEVDEHPLPQLLVLGGSTLAAVSVSLVFTRRARVWCRYLCPVSLLFGVFSRLGAASFQVDRARLEASLCREPTRKGKCPVLIHLPAMTTARDCLMCFQCAGWRDAIHLGVRRPGEELERIATAQPLFWEVIFLFGGAIGLPLGVFYAEAFELEGFALLGALLAATACGILVLSAATALSALALTRGRRDGRAWAERFVQIGYVYAPLSLFSLFLGLSQPTFASLVTVGLPLRAVLVTRAAALAFGASWGALLASRMGLGAGRGRRVVALVHYAVGASLVVVAWARVLLVNG